MRTTFNLGTAAVETTPVAAVGGAAFDADGVDCDRGTLRDRPSRDEEDRRERD